MLGISRIDLELIILPFLSRTYCYWVEILLPYDSSYKAHQSFEMKNLILYAAERANQKYLNWVKYCINGEKKSVKLQKSEDGYKKKRNKKYNAATIEK